MGDPIPTSRRQVARPVETTPTAPAKTPRPPAKAPPPPTQKVSHRPRRTRFQRWVRLLAILAVCFVVCGLVGGELFLRYDVGIGDPPISMADPLTGYRFVPSQTCMRLHHLVHYNAYSMRSDDFPPHKTDPTELRVLMIGDSVINGGSMMDQSELVSTLLQKSLSDDLHRPVVVGNASAGGWGPPSELGWLKTFGTLDADVVVLVLSSHNYANVPQWPAPLGPAFDRPTRKPLLAWLEFLDSYASWLTYKPPPESFVEPSLPRQSDINWCLWSIEQMIAIAHTSGASVIVAQHAQRQELDGHWKEGHAFIEATARKAGADLIAQFEPQFLISRTTGRDPYRPFDNIHPNKIGHELMAEELEHDIEKVLDAKDGQPRSSG